MNLQQHGNPQVTSSIWMLCVSPYPHYRPERPTNPCLYWLGKYRDEHFHLGEAAGTDATTLVAGFSCSLELYGNQVALTAARSWRL